ncbi:MAG: DEAD/DEAH box helicase [Spirochaetes bacterium]|nr:DEAD/DEAH box helicase [Spirochaetota bacterium]
MERIKRFIESSFTRDVRANFTVNGTPGSYVDFPDNVNSEIRDILAEQGITRLYEHQAEAFRSIESDIHTLIVSRTASGKTLSFFLPIINEYIRSDQPFTVMLLYPTKALSRDQEKTFGKLMSVVDRSGRLGTFDGDTPRDERERIQRSADFIVTNPDMLHSGILPNHNRKWRGFLSRLRYVVVDEVHMYRGAFGSHVSNVFRRLQRVCSIHGSDPVFVCSSATIRNPEEHARLLFHRDFKVIDYDSSPQPEKYFYFINPALQESHGHAVYRKGPASVSIPLIREAVRNNIRTICFCRARQEVERLYRAVADDYPELREKVKPYRGGLLPNERRRIERDLAEGRILAIITTNALELGIDIGDLDLCILSGHPGTIASFWQQAGRVGRKGKSPVIVYAAKDRPIDQFLVHHPDFITNTPIEQALLNPDNPYIILQHLPCAAQEHPLRETEDGFDDTIYNEALNILRNEKVVVPYHDALRYALQDYPARGVNIRGMTDYNIEIFCGTEVIGELDPIGARGTLYKDAIYQHLGRKYMSMDLDLDKKLCRVEPVEVDYYTEAVWEGRVDLVESEGVHIFNNARIEFGSIRVNRQPKLYKKIRERTYENIGYGPITLAAFEYDTTGFNIVAPPEWSASMDAKNKLIGGAAYYGLGYILRHASTVFCMSDIKDINTDISLYEADPGLWKSALYLYDTIEGGVGYAERVFERIEEVLRFCRDLMDNCECESGCPSCVPPLPPGVDSRELEEFLIESNAAVECTASLLAALLEKRIVIPDILISKKPIEHFSAPPEDIEKKRVLQKLGRAARILRDKRERLH